MLGLTGVIHSGHNINHSKVDSMEWRPGGTAAEADVVLGGQTWQHISLLGASCCRLNMVGVLEIMSSSTRVRLMMAVSSVALGCPGGAAAEADAVLGGQTGQQQPRSSARPPLRPPAPGSKPAAKSRKRGKGPDRKGSAGAVEVCYVLKLSLCNPG